MNYAGSLPNFLLKDYIRKTVNFYDQNSERYCKNTIHMVNIPWMERFASFLPKNGKILDAGCGFGRDASFFADNGLKYDYFIRITSVRNSHI